jgi:hypothetical protein
VEVYVAFPRRFGDVSYRRSSFRRRAYLPLLRPFKHVITVIQKGNEPSLYLVLICVLTLRKALGSFDNLVNFNKENDETSTKKHNESDDDQYDLESVESDGKLNHYSG